MHIPSTGGHCIQQHQHMLQHIYASLRHGHTNLFVLATITSTLVINHQRPHHLTLQCDIIQRTFYSPPTHAEANANMWLLAPLDLKTQQLDS